MADLKSDLAELDAALQSLRQVVESTSDEEAIALLASLRTLVHALESELRSVNLTQ
jgi:predicted negative regulator of RcsB-dependent stress response